MDHLIYTSEQYNKEKIDISDEIRPLLVKPEYRKLFYHDTDMICFHLANHNQNFTIDTNYFVGVDWLIPEQAAVYVEPKLNGEIQVDFLGMLLQSLEAPENLEHLDGLFHVDYDSPWIDIPEQKDRLSPILIVQFLKLVQRIVQKGLKKSYYRITQNLNSRVKGKILVGQQIKENIVKNRLARTVCNFQEYDINTTENQFLKLVLQFVSSYLNQKHQFFDKVRSQQLQHILSYCMPSFEHVDVLKYKHQKIQAKRNVFYREYEEAIKIGEYILKRFSFNINKASQSHAATPPFWIDMSKLFELYVFGKLKKRFPAPGMLTYHDNFKGGKQTDILLRAEGFKCVIDCKYKPQYENDDPSLADKRQLAGYTRLKSVYKRLGIPYEKIVKGLIIYSHQGCDQEIAIEKLFSQRIEEYIDFYKLGVRLPHISLPDRS